MVDYLQIPKKPSSEIFHFVKVKYLSRREALFLRSEGKHNNKQMPPTQTQCYMNANLYNTLLCRLFMSHIIVHCGVRTSARRKEQKFQGRINCKQIIRLKKDFRANQTMIDHWTHSLIKNFFSQCFSPSFINFPAILITCSRQFANFCCNFGSCFFSPKKCL